MQQRSCRMIQLLLSKYADDEASQVERQHVEVHVASCKYCAGKLAEYANMSAMLSSASSNRRPEPQLGAGLFQEIRRLKGRDSRKQGDAKTEKPWYLPAVTPRTSRVWEAASPLLAVTLGVFALVAIMIFSNKTQPEPNQPSNAVKFFPPVPTVALPIASNFTQNNGSNGLIPEPISTRGGNVTLSPVVPASATAQPNDDGQMGVFALSRPVPIGDEGDAAVMSDWHVVRDTANAYSIAYPPNWWTRVSGQSRSFYPWGQGGTRYSPYWVELRVQPNTQHLNASTGNVALYDGHATIVSNGQGQAEWLRFLSSDEINSYEELSGFDDSQIYTLKLTVPIENATSNFQERWSKAQDIFSRMSGKISPDAQQPTSAQAAPVLFLNGTDLWSVLPGSGRTRAITHGYAVHSFALSPDMRKVAFTSSRSANDAWGKDLYLSSTDENANGGSDSPVSVWPDSTEIHDIAWYNDRQLVAIASTSSKGYGIYKISLSNRKPGDSSAPASVELITPLPDDKFGAKGLAVSPDRQLITFLAPLGGNAGTDIYAVRPDGSDLRRMVSHSEPVSPLLAEERVLAPDSQAIKSYVWVEGHLEYDGYRYNILLTCGDAASPTFYRGGFLYSAPGLVQGPLLDQEGLGILDPVKMQVIHLAYSTAGKVAMTGYYSDRGSRADQLAGLWVADIVGGRLTNRKSLPIPGTPNGITDLQWSPGGKTLIYRETQPQDASSLSSTYDPSAPFSIVELDPASSSTSTLYSSNGR